MKSYFTMNGPYKLLGMAIYRLKLFYMDLRIKQKLFFIQILMVLIVSLTSLIVIQIAFNIYEGILGEESAKVLNLSTTSIENELKQVERFSATIIADRELQKSLSRLKTHLTYSEHSLEVDKVIEILSTITFEYNIISVNVVDARGKQYAGGMVIASSIIQRALRQAAAKEGAMVFVGPYKEGKILICARQIREIGNPRNPTLRPIGTLVILVNMAGFVYQSTAQPINQDVNLLIRSKEKTIYASNAFLRNLTGRLPFQKDSGYRVMRILGQNYFIAHTRSPYTNWEYISGIPYEIIFKQIRFIRRIILVIFILLFVLTILWSLKLAHHLTRPLEELTTQMRQVAIGQQGMELVNSCEDSTHSSRRDEIGELQTDFRLMIHKIDTLIKENYTKQLIIKDAQLKALQAQINPHFLYNTLESINWLAKVHKQQEISSMAEALGNLLRKTIGDAKQVISLQAEIELVQDYITIQKARFGERLDFQLNIPAWWRQFLIPKMSLQPLVENSINYGLEKMLGVCIISVRALEMDGRSYIEISDNGPGMDLKTIHGIREGTIEPQGSGIGLKNIIDRMRLIFGPEYEILILSEPGRGTRVRLPVFQRGETDV